MGQESAEEVGPSSQGSLVYVEYVEFLASEEVVAEVVQSSRNQASMA